MGLAVLLLACGIALLPFPIIARILLGAALLVVSIATAFVVRRRAGAQGKSSLTASGMFVETTSEGVWLTGDREKKNLVPSWEGPLGIVLLACYGRPHALLSLTTPTQTRFLPVRLDDKAPSDDALLASITVLADLDLIEGLVHEAALSPTSAASLVRCVLDRCPDAAGRVYANDGRRTPISVTPTSLTVGDRQIDLTRPFEWRPLMFHESTGQVAPLFQGTWIRQGSCELVMVAPMPASLLPRDGSAKDIGGQIGRALTRDLRLLQAHAEAPPPRDARVPIDRAFMLVVRRTLSEAPRSIRHPGPSPRTRVERRSPLVS